MAEYIEKKDLLKVLPPKCNMGDMYATAYNTCLNTIENLIKEHPTADVVPVVRCKDCVFWDTESIGFSDEHICKMHSIVAVHSRYTNPTDYCSYGERQGSG